MVFYFHVLVLCKTLSELVSKQALKQPSFFFFFVFYYVLFPDLSDITAEFTLILLLWQHGAKK